MICRAQKGVALVLVLWVIVLVTVSTGAFALMARMDGLESHSVMWSTKARLAAEAGINLAVMTLRAPDGEESWSADGRSYVIQFEDVLLDIQITDERGKVDINAADAGTLTNLFMGHGLDEDSAILLAAAVEDWRDEDEIERVDGAELPTYRSAGLDMGPGNRPFVIAEELLQVIGMSYALFQNLEEAITVYASGSGAPDPAFGPAEALVALPETTPEDAVNFVEERRSHNAEEDGPLTMPNGQVAMARGRGLTYSIHVKATLPNEVWDQVEATIRLGGDADGRPYRILRWREGFHQ